MEYTVKKLTGLAGISARTVRYYDQIGLLKPKHVLASGYRVYGPQEIDRLQAILFYRELGFNLEEIKRLIDDPSFDSVTALTSHRAGLMLRKARLEVLIENVEKTLRSKKGWADMGDKEKFEGFKEEMVRENERKYGDEIRSVYGHETEQESKRLLMKLTHEEYGRMQDIESEIKTRLQQAVSDKADSKGEIGKRIARLHKEWLGFTWPKYSTEAHAGLVEMYVDDERFTAYYDKDTQGCAAFLKSAVLAWLKT